jgi:hypothetical protein
MINAAATLAFRLLVAAGLLVAVLVWRGLV